MDIVIASGNVHKIRELRDLFKLLRGETILSLLNFPAYKPPIEEGLTFQEIATKKAEHAAKTLNVWALADDTGIIVPALNNAPGIHSRYYAGEDATDRENRQKLLKELEGKTGLERAAYCECCLALASPEGLHKISIGMCEGYIATEERGRNGSGYDPIFIKNDYDKTFAELDESTKNRISHRRKAFEKMALYLESLKILPSATARR